MMPPPAVPNYGLANALAARLQQQRQAQRWRCLQVQPEAVTNKPWLNFSSNDYLGLSQHRLVISAYQQGLQRFGSGSGASPLVTGYSQPHHVLAESLADWLGVERVLLFNSGYSANVAVLQTLTAAGAQPLLDKYCHASLYDGAAHAVSVGARSQQRGFLRFHHNDYQHLAHQLKRSQTNMALVVSEGLFSMDGDAADWPQLQQACYGSAAATLLDDAHAIGVLGDKFRGSVDQPGPAPSVVTGTFGKAFGVAGAFVATDHLIADSVVNYGRHFIYSTAFAPAQACAIQAALQVMQTGEMQQVLRQRIAEFRQAAKSLQLPIGTTPTHEFDSPIQPIFMNSIQHALAFSQALAAHGITAVAIRPPTVPTPRVRFTLSARHSAASIQRLFTAISEIMAADKELAHALCGK